MTNPTDPPARPSIPETRRALTVEAARIALDHFVAMRGTVADWIMRLDDYQNVSHAEDAMNSVAGESARAATRTILALGYDEDELKFRPEMFAYPPSAVVHRGRLFVIVPHPDHRDVPEGSGDGKYLTMHLYPVEGDAFLDLDAMIGAPVPGPETKPRAIPIRVEDATPHPAERPAPRIVPTTEPGPRPLMRGTLTLAAPWDTTIGPPLAVTIEIIILASGTHVDDVTATREDVPELEQGGWSTHMAGPMDIHWRVIA